MGLFGSALIYGDGVITPAIFVLSALEGVNVATDTLLLWFMTIGLIAVLHCPAVLAAFDPKYAAGFPDRSWLGQLYGSGWCLSRSYRRRGDVRRHGSRWPESDPCCWFCVVLPALFLSCAGHVAGLLDPAASKVNPFFLIVPAWALYPMVVLATVATIIASQAIITGAFSLIRQGMQLVCSRGSTCGRRLTGNTDRFMCRLLLDDDASDRRADHNICHYACRQRPYGSISTTPRLSRVPGKHHGDDGIRCHATRTAYTLSNLA
jgi:K+ potassium transporter